MKRPLALCLLSLLAACDPDPVPPPTPPKSAVEQAEDLMRARDLAAAKSILEGLRATGEEDPRVSKRLVEIYRAEGDQARAIQRAKAGLAAHPDALDLYVPLCQLYLDVGQIEEAKQLLAEARTRGVDEVNVSLLTGAALAKGGDTRGARVEFERAQKAGADEKVAAMNLGLLELQEKHVNEALAIFEDLTKKHPEMAGPKREIARLLLLQATESAQGGAALDKAKVDRAMNLLWDVKDELKSDWRVHEAMGDGWLLLGDLEASLLSYTEALKLGQNPKSVEDRYRVAKGKLMEQKQAQEAASGGK